MPVNAPHFGPTSTHGEPQIAALVAALADALRARGDSLCCAESCTGGLIAAACTELAGSSNWFERGFVTYSNAAKTELLGVPEALIAAQGAVSEAVAAAMAQGALRHAAAQWSVAVTGIAGPSGGSAAKPVGTVCFGWGWTGPDRSHSRTATLHFAGDRAQVRQQSVAHALRELFALVQAAAGQAAVGQQVQT